MMTVKDLIQKLGEFNPETKIVLVDLNGLYWFLEPDLIKMDDKENVLVIGDKDINVIDGPG
jgi:hypothetical protein